jgi:RNA 3'-terminal phosphate cyclase (ATP)/RNA 3'-terminal phosphate cyclase (GTP)
MIDIDGSSGEGGGQILRAALGLSVVTGKGFRIHSIRANRPKPGLAAQHLAGILAVAEASSAALTGAALGSRELEFVPGKEWKSEVEINVGTAGSISLVLQALMLAAVGKDLKADVRGGTDVRMSPPIGYLQHVLLPLLDRMGFESEVEVLARGFYPEGGGRVSVSLTSRYPLLPIQLGKASGRPRIYAEGVTQNLPAHVGDRMAMSFKKYIIASGGAEARCLESRGLSTGAGLTVWADFGEGLLGADALGERGVPAERVGELAAEKLMALISSGAGVDEHAADHLLPFLALAAGPSSMLVREVTPHMETQMETISLFLPARIRVQARDGLHLIEVDPNRT